MSTFFARTTKRCFPLNFVPKRHLNQSPSLRYLKLWEKSHVDYVDAMSFKGKKSRFSVSHQGATFADYPKLVTNIFKLESAMNRKGLVPFVHAQPHFMKVAMELDAYLNDFPSFFRRFRPSAQEGLEDFIRDSYASGKGDFDPELRPHLVSMSYALTCSMSVADSAAYHGFWLNSRPDVKKLGYQAIVKVLKHHHFGNDRAHSCARLFVEHLWEEYQNLKVGNFLVVGVPQKLVERMVYDAKAWGKPTGNRVWDVVKSPESCPRVKYGHQARLVMHPELLEPSSGVSMVTASNPQDVEEFCRDMHFTSKEEHPKIMRLLPHDQTQVEESERLKKELFDDKLKWMFKNKLN